MLGYRAELDQSFAGLAAAVVAVAAEQNLQIAAAKQALVRVTVVAVALETEHLSRTEHQAAAHRLVECDRKYDAVPSARQNPDFRCLVHQS